MDNALIKKITTEKKFATAVYKNFMSLRYGMDPCCVIDMDEASLAKWCSDWKDLSGCDDVCVTTVGRPLITGFLRTSHMNGKYGRSTQSILMVRLDIDSKHNYIEHMFFCQDLR